MTREQFIEQVREIMLNEYGLSLEDCTNTASLIAAYEVGETPRDYCDWLYNKFDLTKLDR